MKRVFHLKKGAYFWGEDLEIPDEMYQMITSERENQTVYNANWKFTIIMERQKKVGGAK